MKKLFIYSQINNRWRNLEFNRRRIEGQATTENLIEDYDIEYDLWDYYLWTNTGKKLYKEDDFYTNESGVDYIYYDDKRNEVQLCTKTK